MKEFLFSYGTLQNAEVQLELFGRILNGIADSLHNYKKIQIEIKDPEFALKSSQHFHSIAIPSADKNDVVIGISLETTPEELIVADKYEPQEYKRVQVTLDSGRQAWVYTSA